MSVHYKSVMQGWL